MSGKSEMKKHETRLTTYRRPSLNGQQRIKVAADRLPINNRSKEISEGSSVDSGKGWKRGEGVGRRINRRRGDRREEKRVGN